MTVRADDAVLALAAQIMDVDGATDLDERRTAWGQWLDSHDGAGESATRGVAGAVADDATRAKDGVDRVRTQIADAVTPDRSTTGSGWGSTSGTEPGALETGAQTGRIDLEECRVRTY